MKSSDGDFNNNSSNKRVISFSLFTIGLILSLIFMVLKLCNVITWAWVMVFLPLIIAVGINILIFILIVLIAIIIVFKS